MRVVLSPSLSFKLPKCIKCKNSFIKNNQQYCRLFKYKFIDNNIGETEYDFYLKTNVCRLNQELCGQYADFFEKK
jgi:hypothetical protein